MSKNQTAACDATVIPRCGVKGCEEVPRYVVSVYERDSDGMLWNVMDTYACEVHAARRGVLKIGDIV